VPGLMCPETQWLWAAHGKHPSAKDFFSIGRGFSLASDFSEWIKKGYPPLAERSKRTFTGISWRFWARGKRKGEIACGLLRDSHDSFGRPYPLMIIGTGPLPSWEEHWEILPSVCERVWCRIEFVSSRGFSALGEFEEEIGKTRPPEPSWSDPGSMAGSTKGGTPPSGKILQTLDRFAEEARKLSREETGIISLDGDGSYDSHLLIMQLNSLLKSNLDMAPTTLFIGGTNNESALIFFRRPIRPADLLTLWGNHTGSD
jgi:type VI secretion system ImpM family protein